MPETPKFDPTKLTPAFLKRLFACELELVEKHQRAAELMYEMMASMAYHAPLVRPCEVRTFALRGVAIVQPTHWLVYRHEDRHRVRAHAQGTLTEPSVPPEPMGYMIVTGRTRAETEPTFIAMHGKRVLGRWGAARCVTEITARQ